MGQQGQEVPSKVDVKPSKVKRIAPGTVIGEGSPKGWTFNLIRTQSAIGAGDLDAATDLIKNLASLYSSILVANVVPNENRTRYVFCRDGYGLYTKVGGKNVIISSDTAKEQGASLSVLQTVALSQREARVDQLTVSARTESMALVDSRTTVLLDGKHQEVMVRHALLLNQQTGRVRTLIWFYLPESGRKVGKVLSEIDVWEIQSLMNVVLHLDKSEFVLGLVTEKAIALNKMAWGPLQIPMPKELDSLARLSLFSEEKLLQLEAGLRSVAAP